MYSVQQRPFIPAVEPKQQVENQNKLSYLFLFYGKIQRSKKCWKQIFYMHV